MPDTQPADKPLSPELTAITILELNRRVGFVQAAIGSVLRGISDAIERGKPQSNSLHWWRQELTRASSELEGDTHAGEPQVVPPTLRIVGWDDIWYAATTEVVINSADHVLLGPFTSELEAGHAARDYLIKRAVAEGAAS